MARSCSICKHPQKLAIEGAFLRNDGQSLRVIAERHEVSAAALWRHKRHLPKTLVIAARAAEVSDASGLLDRVETLITEAQRIAAAAQKAKDWKAALGALREIRSNLELLARLSGELTAAASLSFHKHLHVEAAPSEEPKGAAEYDLEIARGVQEATYDFSLEEFERLKRLVHPVVQ